jgi:cell division protein FtsB
VTARTLIIALLLLFIGLQYKLWVAHGGLVQSFHLRHAVAHQQEKNHQLQQKNASLVRRVAELENGNQAIAGLARSQLGMIKKDEVYYRFVFPTNKAEKAR